MPTLQKEVTIKAPVEKVFEYIDEANHFPEFWPSLYEVKDVKMLPKGGHSFAWFYNMAGDLFGGKAETFEYTPNKKIVDKVWGDLESTFAWTFFGENGTTKVAFKADYQTPKFFDEKKKAFAMRFNEFEADTLMANLKARFEIY